ncbi:plantaricin C family lantibiotic [Modestobacter sp. VKM Ac-2977]|uniref:plantaricin C family lantibiotic n=1 Tax=Modestobacter sp. VKM Ac-2977 TaxID=3004131 RepID=UPI0022AA3D1F|nr:plantaricin C family lantibiotic [Modestobacter sp. VKM Ac-2977]MCZ2819826.1 plantaricin C family lantibiotic [Modestobacter sp. VKM Ac-2977]
MKNDLDPAVSLIEELDDQDLAGSVGDQAGGLFTFKTTKTVGAVCTISWECSGRICGIFW